MEVTVQPTTKRGPGRPRFSDPVQHVCLNMPSSLYKRIEEVKVADETVQEYIRRSVRLILEAESQV